MMSWHFSISGVFKGATHEKRLFFFFLFFFVSGFLDCFFCLFFFFFFFIFLVISSHCFVLPVIKVQYKIHVIWKGDEVIWGIRFFFVRPRSHESRIS